MKDGKVKRGGRKIEREREGGRERERERERKEREKKKEGDIERALKKPYTLDSRLSAALADTGSPISDERTRNVPKVRTML